MRRRRAILMFIGSSILLVLLAGALPKMIQESPTLTISFPWQHTSHTPQLAQQGSALEALQQLPVKGRAPKTGYTRAQFGDGWATLKGCNTREIIMYRDLTNVSLSGECTVASGALNDPYTGQSIEYTKEKASEIQIDHVVALSDAWQTGAQQLSSQVRQQLANDPLELLAVSGKQNQIKSDADAASWLPPNKSFRCQYVARQIAIKQKYNLWVTAAEQDAMGNVLQTCPTEGLPKVQ